MLAEDTMKLEILLEREEQLRFLFLFEGCLSKSWFQGLRGLPKL